MRPITVHVRPGSLSAADAEATHRALEHAMDGLGIPPETEIALVLTADDELGALNQAYRGIGAPTDVLSFAADPADLPAEEAPYLGDVVISVERAAANAAAAGHSLTDELAVLAIHGLLHLVGYEDETEQGAATMQHLVLELRSRQGSWSAP